MKITNITVPIVVSLLLAGCAASPGAGGSGSDGGGSDSGDGGAPAPTSRAECNDKTIDLLTQGHPEGYTAEARDAELPAGFEFATALGPSCVFSTTSTSGDGIEFTDFVIGYVDVTQDEASGAFAQLQSIADAHKWIVLNADGDFVGDDMLAGSWTSDISTPDDRGHLDLEAITPLGPDFAGALGLPEDSGFMSIKIDVPAK